MSKRVRLLKGVNNTRGRWKGGATPTLPDDLADHLIGVGAAEAYRKPQPEPIKSHEAPRRAAKKSAR